MKIVCIVKNKIVIEIILNLKKKWKKFKSKERNAKIKYIFDIIYK